MPITFRGRTRAAGNKIRLRDGLGAPPLTVAPFAVIMVEPARALKIANRVKSFFQQFFSRSCALTIPGCAWLRDDRGRFRGAARNFRIVSAMKDQPVQSQFIQLRALGRSFASIARELDVSKPTLIAWSRKFRFEIQNLRAIEDEALLEQVCAARDARIRSLAGQLKAIEAELAGRDFASVPTPRLFGLAESLRRQLRVELGPAEFVSTVKDIPNDEYCEEVQQWLP